MNECSCSSNMDIPIFKLILHYIKDKKQTYLPMHIPNQHAQNIYYYPPYQHSSTVPIQFSQSLSTHQIHYRTEPVMHHQRFRNQPQFIEPKVNYNGRENQHFIFKKQSGKPCSVYSAQTQVSKYNHYQTQNIESGNLNISKASATTPLDNSQRNKSMLSVKRKESVNSNSRQAREQYYKGQQQIQELINRLPQIDLQPLGKNNLRSFHTSPSVQLKIKQIKKVSSPFSFHPRSVSFKDQNFSDSNKKSENHQNNQNFSVRESLKFNSPPKFLSHAIKSFKQNPQMYNDSRCSTRRESNADTSNCTSILIDSGQYKMNSFGATTFHTEQKTTQSKKQAQCQADIQDPIISTKLSQLKQLLQKSQTDLEQQKKLNHQKQLKIKNLQHQLSSIKINFQKKTLITQKQNNLKKQQQINSIRQQFEKQLARFMADIKQKSNIEIRENQAKFQRQMENMKSLFMGDVGKLENQVRNLGSILVEKQNQLKKIVDDFKLLEEQKVIAVKNFDNMKLVNHKLIGQIQAISSQNKQLKEQSQRLKQAKTIQQNAQKSEKTFAQKQVNIDLTQNNFTILSQYTSQIQSLQQKLLSTQNTQQKHIQKCKQYKQQLQKSLRKIDQLSNLAMDKDMKCKNMLKDLRSRDRFITDLTKNCNQLQSLVKTLNNQILKLELKIKNDKYRILQNQPQTKIQDQNIEEPKTSQIQIFEQNAQM